MSAAFEISNEMAKTQQLQPPASAGSKKDKDKGKGKKDGKMKDVSSHTLLFKSFSALTRIIAFLYLCPARQPLQKKDLGLLSWIRRSLHHQKTGLDTPVLTRPGRYLEPIVTPTASVNTASPDRRVSLTVSGLMTIDYVWYYLLISLLSAQCELCPLAVRSKTVVISIIRKYIYTSM